MNEEPSFPVITTGELRVRNETIEECARVVLESGEDKEVCDYLTACIRALKDKP